SPACTSVVQTVAAMGQSVPGNTGDSDWVYANATLSGGVVFGYGGKGNISGTIPPGGQGLVVVSFS
ncbi:hypothetical protein, partial [Streptococcus pneumoniae]|uniref:hypothetical protein n=1 Tax=Streptococcus pneumoniae TaxID=1313 RepID=UPI00195343AA